MNSRLKALIVVAAVAALLPVTVASAQGSPKQMVAGVTVKTTTLGPTLVDAKGMTLYTWGNDTIPGKSACNGSCATNWPPLVAAADATPGFSLPSTDRRLSSRARRAACVSCLP